MKKIFLNEYDNLFDITCLLTKSKEWEREDEWRMFSTVECNPEKKDHKCIAKIKPKAVYLGINIEYKHELEIIKICKNRNISCYKMRTNLESKSFDLEAYKIY